MKTPENTNERLLELYLEKAMEQYEAAAGQAAMEELDSRSVSAADAAVYVAHVDARWRHRQTVRRTSRRALVLLAILVACFAILMGTVSAFRVVILNLVYSNGYADLGDLDQRSEFIDLEHKSLPQYNPPGYSLAELRIEDEVLCATYLKEKTLRIDYSAYPSEMEHFLDTETDTEQDPVVIEINGAKGLLIRRGKAISVGWWTNTSFYELYSHDSSEEELLRMAESVSVN